VVALRGLQQDLAEENPDDPRRVFGEAVESAGYPTTTQLAKVCTDALAAAVPGILEKLTQHIDERLLEARQHVHLNVRAPKRTIANDPPITRDITAAAGRLLPLAKYLDEMERRQPDWKEARRSFAPTFGMVVQVLKKRKLKSDGEQAVYVEQNARPQVLYTENDRPLLDEAWQERRPLLLINPRNLSNVASARTVEENDLQLTAAHREDLLVSRRTAAPAPAGVPGAPEPAPEPEPVPRVVAMLQQAG